MIHAPSPPQMKLMQTHTICVFDLFQNLVSYIYKHLAISSFVPPSLHLYRESIQKCYEGGMVAEWSNVQTAVYWPLMV